MASYQITFRTPNGKKWRIRPASGSEFRQLTGEILHSASDRIKNLDLLALWPELTIDRWKSFAADCFDAVLRSVRDAVKAGSLSILKTGDGLLTSVSEWMDCRGWKEVKWSDIAKRLLKIVLSLAVGYLRTQFPAITSRNASQAVDAFGSLISQYS